MAVFVSKWTAAIEDKGRCELMKGCIKTIQREAKRKGYTASYFEMARIIRGQGVNISDAYMYKHFNGSYNRYPFPFECLYMLCRGYNIPLSVVFSEQVTKGLK